jgi:gliding motility-associated-like protein
MKYSFLFFFLLLTTNAFSNHVERVKFARPLADSLVTTIRVNGFATATVNVCNSADAINIVGTIATTTGGVFNGFSEWTTLGSGSFADAGALNTTYTPSSADLTAGSVRLVLQPDCVCPRAADTVNIVFYPPVLLTNITTTNATACNASNGSITLIVTGGVNPFQVVYNKIGSASVSVNLSNNANNRLIINGLGDGNYRITSIIDARGCPVSGALIGQIFSIDKPATPSLGGGGIVPIASTSCSTCNGELAINLQGGTAPFNITYTVAGNNLTRTGLTLDANNTLHLGGFCASSITNLNIIDVNNCATQVFLGPFAISEPQHPLIGTDGVQVVNASSCNSNSCDGRLEIRIATTQTGASPYTVRFDSLGATKIRTNLPLTTANQIVLAPLCPNVYRNILITDANGCALQTNTPLVGPFTILQPLPPRIDTIETTNFCGSATGNIKILLNTMQLGRSPFRIVLNYNTTDSLIYNNVTSVANIINLGNIPPNLYTSVKIIDANGCFSIYNRSIRIFKPLTATITTNGCQPTASLNLTPSGNGSFLYRWNTNAQTQDLINQNAGIYTVTITDVTTACTLSLTATVAPCSAVINTTLLLNDTLRICLPVGDLPQPASSLTTCATPTYGTVNITNNACFEYIANSSFVGTTQFCMLQCNAATTLCDTTFVNVTIYYAVPGSATVLDTVGINSTAQFCPPTNQLNAPPFTVTQICTNTSPNIHFQLINNCLYYTGNSAGQDTACVVICDALGACDTTLLYIAAFPTPRPNDDSITVPVQTLSVIDILANDNLYGIPVTSVTLLNGTQDGTIRVTTDNKISFKSSAGVCRNILPIFCKICTAAGCDSTTLYIKVICEAEKPLTVYTFMSPNNDGYNDAFRIDGLQKFPNALLSIYDRWGSLVYQQADYKNDWLGTMNNAPLPDGTYFYVLELKDADSAVKKGYFQMAR